jgi:hypothetical protein
MGFEVEWANIDPATNQHWQGLFPVAITVHNLDEAVWLPAWSRTAGRWHVGVGAFEFRLAVAVLTALAWVVTGSAFSGVPGVLELSALARVPAPMLGAFLSGRTLRR